MNKGLEALKEIIEVDEAQLTSLSKDKSKKRDVMLHRHWLRDKANIVETELKALEIIKELFEIKISKNKFGQCFVSGKDGLFAISQEKYDLLKEVLL